MNQTRIQSALETMSQTGIGLAISILAGQFWIYPHYNIHPTWMVNTIVTLWFTTFSIVRGYLVRRFFNWWNQ